MGTNNPCFEIMPCMLIMPCVRFNIIFIICVLLSAEFTSVRAYIQDKPLSIVAL